MHEPPSRSFQRRFELRELAAPPDEELVRGALDRVAELRWRDVVVLCHRLRALVSPVQPAALQARRGAPNLEQTWGSGGTGGKSGACASAYVSIWTRSPRSKRNRFLTRD